MKNFKNAKEIFSEITNKNNGEILYSQIISDTPDFFDATIFFQNKRTLNITVENFFNNKQNKVLFWEKDKNTKLIETTTNSFSIDDFDFEMPLNSSYQEIKRKYNWTDADISEIFGYKNREAYAHSSGKLKIERGVEILHHIFSTDGNSAKK